MACYPLQGSLREPQTTAFVTFIWQWFPAGNTHTPTDIQTHTHQSHPDHSQHSLGHDGAKEPITAYSSKLGSRAQSVETDCVRDVSGLWFVTLQLCSKCFTPKVTKGVLQSLETLHDYSSL